MNHFLFLFLIETQDIDPLQYGPRYNDMILMKIKSPRRQYDYKKTKITGLGNKTQLSKLEKGSKWHLFINIYTLEELKNIVE